MVPAETRQLEKIAKYKALRQGGKSQQANEDEIRLNRINKILDEEFTKSEIKLSVSRMKPELAKL